MCLSIKLPFQRHTKVLEVLHADLSSLLRTISFIHILDFKSPSILWLISLNCLGLCSIYTAHWVSLNMTCPWKHHIYTPQCLPCNLTCVLRYSICNMTCVWNYSICFYIVLCFFCISRLNHCFKNRCCV